MKNYFKVSAIVLSAVALFSCTLELDNPTPQEEETGVIYHDALIIASENVETKTYLESDGEGGYFSKWDDQDQIGLFQKNSVDGYRTKVTSKKSDITITDEGKTASFGVALAEIDGAVNYKYWAVYPDGAATRSSDELSLTIPQEQTFTSGKFDKAADVLISEPVERADFSSDALVMGFARVGSVAKMTLKGLTEGETLKSVTFSTTEDGKYLAGTVKYDLAKDELKDGISSGKQSLTLTAGESIVVPASGQVDVWFRTADVTLEDNFTVVVYTRDAGLQNYSYTKAVNLASAGKTLAFNTGKIAAFGVSSLGSGKETLEYEPLIAEGYYVLHVTDTEQGDKVLANTCAGSGFLDAVANPFSLDANNKYNADSNPELIWKLEFDKENNKYAFYSPESGKYIIGNLGASSSSAEWFWMGANTGSQTGTFTIYNGATFSSASHIGYNYNNGTNPRFKFYGDSKYPGNMTFTPAYSAPVVAYSDVNLPSSDEVSDPVSIFPTKMLFTEDIDIEGVYNDVACTIDATWISANMANSATGEIQYRADENTDDSPRTAYIKVYALGENALDAEIVFTITQPAMVAPALAGDNLWLEDFSDVSVSSGSSTAGNSSCNVSNVYGNSVIAYAYSDNGSNKTLVYGQANAGGTTPELLIGKKANNTATVWGIFTASGIPTSSFVSMTLSFIANGDITLTSDTIGITIGEISSEGNNRTAIITNEGGSAKFFNLSFENRTTGNIRIDDIVLVAGAPAPGITVTTSSATAVTSATGTTATLNGSLTLVNEAVNSSVTEAGFYYKLTSAGSYTKVTCASAPTSTTDFSYDLTGLTKDSEYTYYAYAIYDDGSEITGDATEKTFTPTKGGGVPPANTVLFSETFDSAADGTSAYVYYSAIGTTSAYDSATYGTITYSRSNSSNVTVENASSAGGTEKQIMINKNGGSLTISGIKTYGATSVRVSFKYICAKSTAPITATCGSTDSEEFSSTSASIATFNATVSGDTFDLVIRKTSTANSTAARFDDITITVIN